MNYLLCSNNVNKQVTIGIHSVEHGLTKQEATYPLLFSSKLCDIGGGAIFLVGDPSGETKIAEGIRDSKNRRVELCITFAGKSG